MPKRMPGGKVKRGTKPSKARAAHRPASGASNPATASETTAAARPAAPVPSARQTPSPVRQSLLNTVRRPAAKSGPALVTDYSYVVADLKRIGLVSGSALVILVALSFVIR